MSRIAHVASAAALSLALAACTAGPAPTPSATPTPEPSAGTTAPASPAPEPTPPPAAVLPDGPVTTIAGGLDAPWSVLRLPDGGVLVSERDTANIVEVGADGSVRTVTHLTEVVPAGEGGLLGLAFREGDGAAGPDQVYAMFTAASDNRIVRMPLTGAPGSLTLGAPEPVFAGIPKAANHNGGRIAFGPDGMLYVTTGDAGQRDAAQDPASLAGKILRLTPDGGVAPGNPFGTAAWSIGHRNPQGIAWDADGGLWAAEFGQNTWDELNRIERGANFGWPVVEGQAGDARFSDPVAQWPTSEASPSGLAIVGDTLVLAALRGERVWTVYPAAAEGGPIVQPWFAGEFGRIRDVVPGPDGELWFVTNNTDGRGSPADGDDRLLRVPVSPVP
ncbi:PQQ-dependent sugar dehydrogenase [Agromyces aerolatus]|uniref:PQQ-dependent sugar dehydrogenase n=1 Tax=Agromyces sp. LY-1074 TaxID=3074080 RepID=UPI0028646453|nr:MULTISPECIES: PQQ-dependent sugar dehydrogenase [unclassified Agromyces]MDR5698439.1 PQQ-dependent sugar dehydrogenase [Agromyces sp. LY-1074]MDR5704733.1 PQQ-dependent sugar dehydrogenase [Agromyces sp. LY-1358]